VESIDCRSKLHPRRWSMRALMLCVWRGGGTRTASVPVARLLTSHQVSGLDDAFRRVALTASLILVAALG